MESAAIQAIIEAVVIESTFNTAQEEAKATTDVTTNAVAAVNLSTITSDTTNDMSGTQPPTEIVEQTATAFTPPAADGITGLAVIDLAKQSELTFKFNDLINNPQYWKNPNRITKLDEALFLPTYDDRSLQQFYNSAKDELIKSAMNLAIKNNTVPIMPTDNEICPLAERKHSAKVAKDLLRDAVKAAKNKTA